MATQTLNVTFDGVNNVPRLPGSTAVSWDTGGPRPTIDRYSVFVEQPDDLDATLNLTGADWRIRMLQVAGEDHITRIKDLDNGADRRIEYLNLGNDSDVDLTSTKVQYMNGWEGEKHDIKLGPQNDWMHFITLGADQNRIDTAVGYIDAIDFYAGKGNVIVRGGVGNIDFGGLKDRLVVDEGRVFSAKMKDGNDTVIVRDGGRIENLNAFGGVNTIDVKDGSRIDHIRGGNGTLDITAAGTGRLETVTAFDGILSLTTEAGNVRAVQGSGVDTDITIGTGGAGTIKFTSATEQTHKITGSDAGYIALIETTDSSSNLNDDQSAIIDVSYFVGTIRTGNGVDRVSTGDGPNAYVDAISTSGGNDTVNVGTGGAGQVSAGRGDDLIRVEELSYILEEQAMVVRGSAGTDELSFARFGSGVTFSLEVKGAAQEVAPDSGFFSAFGIENLSGSNRSDTLTGDDGANVLSAGKGNDRVYGGDDDDLIRGDRGFDKLFGERGRDTLLGGDGNDVLNGGLGNDMLTGNAGADVFVFGRKSGTDRVKDFQDGTDILRLDGHTGGFADLTITNAGNNLRIAHDHGVIILAGEAGTALTAADFDFV